MVLLRPSQHWQQINRLAYLGHLQQRLDQQSVNALYRTRVELQSPQGVHITLASGDRVSFCSNDYLGLASHRDISSTIARSVETCGVGSGASHLVSGHSRFHRELEERLAALTGAQKVLLFANGYMANLALLSVLAGRNSTIIADRLNHASLIDGAILSRARFKRYRHLDADDARAHADQAVDAGDSVVIATDSAFSMDGDIAPLATLDRLANDIGAPLVVDDAHGFGVLGEGTGAVKHFGLSGSAIMMATLGKAVGVYGAFVAADARVIESLIQFARPYIYTTALPPALAAGCITAINIMENESWRRRHLANLIARFKHGAAQLALPLLASDTPIQPVLCGSSEAALAASRWLDQCGYLVTAIRPPTVPQGTARLRITMSAAHSDADVDGLLSALAEALHQSKSNGHKAPQ